MVPPGSKAALCTAETAQVDGSDRIDETKIKVKGTWYYSSSERRSTRRAGRRIALRRAHADTRRPRCFPFHTTGVTDVHEHTDGARRWRSMVSGGVKQTGRALGESDVREAERSGAVVFSLQATDKTVLSTVAA